MASLDTLREELALQREALMRSLNASAASRVGAKLPPMTPTQHLAAEQYLRVASDLKRLEAEELEQERALLFERRNPTSLLSPSAAALKGPLSVPLKPSPAVSHEQDLPHATECSALTTRKRENDCLPAEFLRRLIEMMTEENSEIIEWREGTIYIHRPEQLEKELLQKYFRSSKLTSFQRQLNYFGFLKESGFGKFAPCCYANEATTSDLQSILKLKRNKPKPRFSKKAVPPKTAPMPAEAHLMHPLPRSAGLPMPRLPTLLPHERRLLQLQQDRQDALLALEAARRQRLLNEARWYM